MLVSEDREGCPEEWGQCISKGGEEIFLKIGKLYAREWGGVSLSYGVILRE